MRATWAALLVFFSSAAYGQITTSQRIDQSNPQPVSITTFSLTNPGYVIVVGTIPVALSTSPINANILGSVTVTPGTGTWATTTAASTVPVSIAGSATVTPGTGTWTTNQFPSYTVTPGTGIFQTNPQGSLTVTQGTASLTTNPWFVAQASTYTTNTYFGTSSSPSINANLLPMKSYSIQVLGNGGTATSWTALLEGSVNNSTFTTILSHSQSTGDGVLLYSGANILPSLYIRSKVTALNLGPATSISVTVLGTQ